MMYIWKVKLYLKRFNEWFGDYYIRGEDFQDAIKQAERLMQNERTAQGLMIVSLKRKFELKVTESTSVPSKETNKGEPHE